MRNRASGWLVGAALGVLFGGILAMDAVADARAATVEVDIELAGAPAQGLVEVRTADGQLVAQGRPGEELRVSAGTYEIRVSCPSARTERVLRAVRLAPRSVVHRVVRFGEPPAPHSL